MLREHVLSAAKRGFACTKSDLRYLMSKIAANGKLRRLKNGLPSEEKAVSFRARHTDLTVCSAENKALVKLKGELLSHVQTYEKVLRTFAQDYPGIFNDGLRVWNMDMTHVSAEYGRKKRMLCSAASHHGGFLPSSLSPSNGRHITVVLAVSASGLLAPPFFIIAGLRVMPDWFKSLHREKYNFKDPSLQQLYKNNWFPEDTAVYMRAKGSMVQQVIPLFIEHINIFVRKHLRYGQYMVILASTAPRKGVECLEIAKGNQCTVVQSPTNVSHFLQACDQFINKRFQVKV